MIDFIRIVAPRIQGALVAVLVACASVHPRSSMSPETAVASSALGAERDRFAAMTARDFVALDTLLADDLLYTHTSGVAETKAQFLTSLRSGRIVYVGISPTDMEVLPLADTAAVITGRSHMRLHGAAADVEFDIRFLDVFVRRANRWVCVRWQSTRIGP